MMPFNCSCRNKKRAMQVETWQGGWVLIFVAMSSESCLNTSDVTSTCTLDLLSCLLVRLRRDM
jgi:hypothetical protein